MSTDNFLKYLGSISRLSEEARKDILHSFKKRELSKGQVLVKSNTVCRHFWFLENGLARVLYYNGEKEVTELIIPENSFFSVAESFIFQKPSGKILELLEDSIVREISFSSLELLFEKHHEIEKLGRKISNYSLVSLHKRMNGLIFTTALQRYQELMINSPWILTRVPLSIVASYIGVSQETLSRIRSNVAVI